MRNTETLDELLKMLAEEGAELAHAAMKASRHGIRSHNPHTEQNNREALRHELADVFAVVRLIAEECPEVGDLFPSTGTVRAAMGRKNHYRHYRNPPIDRYKVEP